MHLEACGGKGGGEQDRPADMKDPAAAQWTHVARTRQRLKVTFTLERVSREGWSGGPMVSTVCFVQGGSVERAARCDEQQAGAKTFRAEWCSGHAGLCRPPGAGAA